MRRTALLVAFASVASLALVAPPADAASAPSDNRLVATASCQGGGQAKLVATVDAAGAEHAAFSASGVPFKHWSGQLVGAQPTGQPIILRRVAKRGRFVAEMTQQGAASVDAFAWFTSRNGHDECIVSTWHDGGKYSADGDVGDLVVKGGTGRGLVHANIGGVPHHLYRFVFTAKTSAGVKCWRMAGRADGDGHVGAGTTTSRSRDLGSFTKLSVTITDRTAKHGAPIHLSLAR